MNSGVDVPSSVHYPKTGAALLQSIEAKHFWFVSRRAAVKMLLERFGVASGASGLDIGCGTGFNVKWLSERGYNMHGIDAYQPLLANEMPGKFRCGELAQFPPTEEYDFLLLLDVLEHISDDAAFLNQAFGFLKPGGVAVITVPALMGLWSEVDVAAGHLRRYTKREVDTRLLATAAPAQKEFESYYYGALLPLFWLSRLLKRKQKSGAIEAEVSPWLNAILKAAMAAERILLKWGGLPFGSSLVIVLRKSSR